MLADAIQVISDLTESRDQANASPVFTLLPGGKEYRIDHMGKADNVPVPARPFIQHARTINGFAEAIAKMMADCDKIAGSPTIYVDMHKMCVECVLDSDDERMHRIKLDLHQTSQFFALRRGSTDAEGAALQQFSLHKQSQKAMVDILRHHFRGDTTLVDVLSQLRTLKWSKNTGATGVVNQGGNEAWGTNEDASVYSTKSGNELNDEFTLNAVPILEELADRHTDGPYTLFCQPVTCSLFVHPQEQKFSVAPVAGEIEKCLSEAAKEIAGQIQDHLDNSGFVDFTIVVGASAPSAAYLPDQVVEKLAKQPC